MNTSTHTKRWFLLRKAKGPMRISLQDPCASKYSIIVLSVLQHSIAWWKCNITEKATLQDKEVRHCSKENSKSHSPRLPCPPLHCSQLKHLSSSPRLPSRKMSLGAYPSVRTDQHHTGTKWCTNTEQKDAIETKELRTCSYIKDDQYLFFFFYLLQADCLICPAKHQTLITAYQG